MHRNVSLLILTILVAATAFMSASYATSSRSTLQTHIPALALQSTRVSTNVQLSISNLIDQEARSRYGITSSSFSHVRLLAATEHGDLLLVPGTRGQCVVLLPAVACGNVGPDEPGLGLLVSDGSNPDLVGGGILASSEQRAAIVRADGSLAPTTAITGGFVVLASQHVQRGDRLVIN